MRLVMSSSYNESGQIQLRVLDSSKAILLKALNRLSSLTLSGSTAAAPRPIVIGDLGVSGGHNSMHLVEFVLTHLHQGHKGKSAQREIAIYYNDLPANDWRPFITELSTFEAQSAVKGPTAGSDTMPLVHSFISPKSFYERLFPASSVDLFVSMITLHWLSRVPMPLPGFAVTHFCPDVSSFPSVIKVWQEAAHRDLVTFLQHRAKELHEGGQMVLSMVAMPDETCDVTVHLAHTLPSLLDVEALYEKGLVSIEEVDCMSICYYFRRLAEIRRAVAEVPELELHDLEQRTEQYTFADPKAAAAFLLSVHENSLLGCVSEGREERRAGILVAIREGIISKTATRPVVSIDYAILSVSRRRSASPAFPLEKVAEGLVADGPG